MLQKAKKIISDISTDFAAAISGGADSMCLLSLIIECGKKDSATVLSISHGIRENSQQDMQFVKDYCNKHGIKFVGYKIDVPTKAQEYKLSIETQARLMRHQIFSDYCKKNNVPILLAHNLDDNIESILMHIFRGSGLNGLVGMSSKDGHIIRPLIEVQKQTIYKYLENNNIPFVEDQTNKDIIYKRNHIRAIFPEIEKSFPAAKKSILSLSSIVKKHLSYIRSQLRQDYLLTSGGAVLLDKNALKTPLVEQYILQAFNKVGLFFDYEQKHITACINLASLENGKSIDLPHGLKVFNEYNYLAFEFLEVVKAQEQPLIEGLNQIGGKKFLVDKTKKDYQSGKIIVDYEKLKGSTVRFRKDGDRFTPCGGGSKKLKEYLNDKKIPLRIRDRLPLITKGSEVLVIVGVELSEKVKVTTNTKSKYLIEVCD